MQHDPRDDPNYVSPERLSEDSEDLSDESKSQSKSKSKSVDSNDSRSHSADNQPPRSHKRSNKHSHSHSYSHSSHKHSHSHSHSRSSEKRRERFTTEETNTANNIQIEYSPNRIFNKKARDEIVPVQSWLSAGFGVNDNTLSMTAGDLYSGTPYTQMIRFNQMAPNTMAQVNKQSNVMLQKEEEVNKKTIKYKEDFAARMRSSLAESFFAIGHGMNQASPNDIDIGTAPTFFSENFASAMHYAASATTLYVLFFL